MTKILDGGIQRAGAFKPGESGNPAGRPRGSRNKTTLAIEALLDGEAEALTRKAIERALAGDPQALRLCLDRIAPPRRDRPTPFALPALAEAADARDAFAAVVRAVADAGAAALGQPLEGAHPAYKGTPGGQPAVGRERFVGAFHRHQAAQSIQ